MPHETPLIATIVAGLCLAFVFGALANRFRVPPLIGYLIAGVLVGPNTPGFVADQSLATELAELGVILLMFGVGLHFSLKDLLSVRAIAVPGAVAQMAVATLLGMGLAWTLGWSAGAGLVFGLALSVASTVVLLRALQERRLIETEKGRIAVGWLIVEDLAMVLTLVLLPPLAGVLGGSAQDAGHTAVTVSWFGPGLWGVVGTTFAKVAAFVILMIVIGRRVIPWVLHYVAHTGSRELFRLAVLAIALGVAFGAANLFGVSLALGAFFAGMVMSESELSHQAAEESLPLRDAFSVLFFVSVGMLFDPASLIESPLPVLATLLIIVFGKSIAAFLIVILFKHPRSTALTISASLAQIGEFSFILAELGVGLNLLPEQGRDLILAGAIMSILINPLLFAAVDRSLPKAEPAPGAPGAAADDESPPPTELTGHTILVGYGRVGKLVGATLKQSGQPFLVVEDSDKALAKLRAEGIEAVNGNAASEATFALVNAAAAKRLILAIPNAFEAGQVVLRAKAANPDIEIIARAHSDPEVDHLTGLGVAKVVMGEREIARGIIEQIETGAIGPQLADEAPPPEAAPSPEADGQARPDAAEGEADGREDADRPASAPTTA